MHRAEFRLLSCAIASLALLALPAAAGLLNSAPEGGYPELPVAAPPAFNPDNTIVIEDKIGAALVLSIDPATVSSDSDGVVRYVSVARGRNGGTMTAMYEGIRCATAEVKLYARHYTQGGWQPVAEPVWRSLYDGGTVQNSMKIAKAGICQDASSGGTSRRIVDNLRNDLLRRAQ